MKHILVGVDGSPESLEAVKWTADLAHGLDADVVVASVFGFYPAMVLPNGAYYLTDETIKSWRQDVQRDIDGDWTKPLRDAGVKVATVVEEGHPSEVLLRLAREHHVDLIVVGSRGHGAVAELFLGSVSHHLVLRAPCPVVVLPHRHADPRVTADRVAETAAPAAAARS